MKPIRPFIEYLNDYPEWRDTIQQMEIEGLAIRNMLEDLRNQINNLTEIVKNLPGYKD